METEYSFERTLKHRCTRLDARALLELAETVMDELRPMERQMFHQDLSQSSFSGIRRRVCKSLTRLGLEPARMNLWIEEAEQEARRFQSSPSVNDLGQLELLKHRWLATWNAEDLAYDKLAREFTPTHAVIFLMAAMVTTTLTFIQARMVVPVKYPAMFSFFRCIILGMAFIALQFDGLLSALSVNVFIFVYLVLDVLFLSKYIEQHRAVRAVPRSWSPYLRRSASQRQCSICLQDDDDDEEGLEEGQCRHETSMCKHMCGHGGHRSCVMQWLNVAASKRDFKEDPLCFLCRQPLALIDKTETPATTQEAPF